MKKISKILCLIAITALPLFAQQMFNACVENETVDCSVTLPTTFTTANAALPDPFRKLDGTRMTTREEWACRRQEIIRLAERTLYGTKPPKPSTVTGTVTNTSISVSVTEGGRSGNFSATVSLPTTGTAPYPAVIRYDNSGADATFLRNNGVAVINLTTSTVGGGTRAAKTGAFYTVSNTHSRTGHLAAWAWGVSRIIDVIEQSNGTILKADAIGVTGCSRSGKGAFVAGVLDSRIALTLPMESGTGGTNIMRGAHRDRDQGGGTNGSQSPSSAYGEQAWLGDDFSPFSTNPNNLPIDIHEVIASIAPRGFLVLDKTASSAGQWLGIPSSHAAAIAAADVYRALGVGGNMHYINTPTSSHCQWSADIYNTRLQNFINIFLHRTGTPGTEPLFTATAAPSMTTWVNWTTPALTGQLTLGGCGSTPPSSSSTGGASSSSSAGAVSSSSANMVQTETCQTPLIAYPTNTVPSDPYNACFRYTNDKCYVCKIENEGEFGGQVNTCASSWVWNGSQIENNLEDGYWYHEVPCPGTSSSSTTSSSSSSDGTLSSSSLASSSSSGTTSILSQYNQQDVVIVKYYNLQGQPLGTQKPITSGVYIVRNSKTGQTQMTVVK